ncbi:MAG TPA: TauD/TfdA family dioxygenase [Xanthobacteraceae bacterium]|nr:TauD/TfdA family dioxygenase [Xanthobacteraceae bacterium]
MASYRRIEVKPIAGALGAEIGNVDLGNVDDETFGEIKTAWLDHLVIFFRGQNISPVQQIALAKRFGEIHHHPFMKGMEEYPDILEIIKEEGDTKAFGEVWHTDQMFNPKPAKATMLYAKETPDAGGDTMFTNMYLAYDTLSEPMKAMLKSIRTWNVGDRKKLQKGGAMGPPARDGRYSGNEKMAAKVRDPGDLQTECAHPIVRTHPETGRKALYISSHTQTLDGFKEDEARPILDFLAEHAIQPEFTCRFRWEVGSLAIWDNRCTQHRALNDYPGKRRRMHRITIAGDSPF